jgi:hypothetical protein
MIDGSSVHPKDTLLSQREPPKGHRKSSCSSIDFFLSHEKFTCSSHAVELATTSVELQKQQPTTKTKQKQKQKQTTRKRKERGEGEKPMRFGTFAMSRIPLDVLEELAKYGEGDRENRGEPGLPHNRAQR